VYAPALVAFFGAPGVRVTIGAPFVSWVALGWGEPVVPWWGRPTFVGRPAWVGWGGPRIVNNVVVNRTTVINVNEIRVYRNTSVQNAVVAVHADRFGRARVQEARVTEVDVRRLEPVRGPLRIAPDPASLLPAHGKAVRPPEATLSRPVVATRPLPRRERATPEATRGSTPEATRASTPPASPAARIVPSPRAAQNAPVPPRAPFGAGGAERRRESTLPASPTQAGRDPGRPEVARPEPARPEAGRPESRRPEAAKPEAPRPEVARPEPGRPQEPRRDAPRPETPRAETVRPQPAAPPQRALPGEPANRLNPGRGAQHRAPDGGGVRGAAGHDRGRGDDGRGGERGR
jgi:hypothetical protein